MTPDDLNEFPDAAPDADGDAEPASTLEQDPRPTTAPVSIGDLLRARMTTCVALAGGEAARERRAQHAVFAARRRAERMERLAADIGLPPADDLRDVALDDQAPETEALRAFREVVHAVLGSRRRQPFTRIVAGPPGTGKTAAMAWALLRLGYEHLTRHNYDRAAQFVSAGDIGATLRGGFGEPAARWERWLAAPVLGIDDVGTELSNPEHLLYLLTERDNRTLVTLATTNLNMKTFGERYASSRLADRLAVGQGQLGAPDGLAWYVLARGVSLRDAKARAALREGGAR